MPSLRRASAAAEAEWVDLSASLASDLLAIQDAGKRAAAYAALSAKLGTTGDGLLPADDARVRASFEAVAPAPQPKNEDHERELAAWRVRDTAARAEMARLDRARRLAVWGLVPAGAVLPAVVAAIAYGWDPMSLASVLPELPTLPMSAVMLAALAAGGLCALPASRAKQVPQAWNAAAAAAVAGVVLLLAARSLPLYIAANGVITRSGQSLGRIVVRVYPNAAEARLEVLRGNDIIQRGEVLDFRGAYPVRFLREGR
ncbi:hypothetical protein [Muricoccus nepalensis]|nr:hypothetical protein [Roseomonas nepalensis]